MSSLLKGGLLLVEVKYHEESCFDSLKFLQMLNVASIQPKYPISMRFVLSAMRFQVPKSLSCNAGSDRTRNSQTCDCRSVYESKVSKRLTTIEKKQNQPIYLLICDM